MKRKFIVALIVTALMFTLASCNSDKTESQTQGNPDEVHSIYTDSPLWKDVFKQYYDKCGSVTYEEVVGNVKKLGLIVDESNGLTDDGYLVRLNDSNLPDHIDLDLYFDKNNVLYWIDYNVVSSTFCEFMCAKKGELYLEHYTATDNQRLNAKDIKEASSFVSDMFEPCDNAARFEKNH